MSEEIKGEKPTEVETQKERLKFRKSALARAQNFQTDLKDAAYKYEAQVNKI